MAAVYWTTEDLDAGRCTLAQLGQARPAVEVLEAVVVLDNSPENMDRVAISTLLRLAQQERDLPTALKAALALLDRTRGRVMPPAQPPMPEPAALPALDEPWLDPNRLSYQANGLANSHRSLGEPCS